jgi:DNA-binding transcriptional regulator YhcF (GntR family)
MNKEEFNFNRYVNDRKLFENEVTERAFDSIDPTGSPYPLAELEDAVYNCIQQGVKKDTIINLVRMLTSKMEA